MQEKLNKLLKYAYGEYSNIQVSAIIKTKNEQYFKGVNVENAAFPSSICAERNAIFSAVTHGVKPGEIIEINITSNVTKDFLYPCAGCLQVMAEFVDPNGVINIYLNNEIKSHKLSELLPFNVKKESFGWK